MWHCGLALAMGLTVSGCEQPGGVAVAASPYSDGAQYVEPVVYNGRRYDVSLRFQPAVNVYDVTVAGKGRKLGGTPGDQQIVEQVAVSAVRHFGCPTGQRGPGRGVELLGEAHLGPGEVLHRDDDGGAGWGHARRSVGTDVAREVPGSRHEPPRRAHVLPRFGRDGSAVTGPVRLGRLARRIGLLYQLNSIRLRGSGA